MADDGELTEPGGEGGGGLPEHSAAPGTAMEGLPGLRRWRRAFNFDWDALQEAVADIKPGCDWDAPNGKTYRVTRLRASRRPGGRGTLELEHALADDVDWWGLDFEEVSLPIRSWTSASSGDGPDLAKLAQWEARRQSEPAAYAAYKYSGDNALEGITRTLAEKIAAGVERYTAHLPVIFRKSRYTDVPPDVGAGLDKTGAPSEPSGWTGAGGGSDAGQQSVQRILSALGDGWTWLKTGDRLTPLDDGTWARIETWRGARRVDADLYPAAAGGGENP